MTLLFQLGLPLALLVPQTLDRSQLEEIVAPVLEQKGIPGAVVGLLVGDELVVSEAFGVRELASGAPMTTDTLFQVGSVTKPFTATLLGLLVGDGTLRYETTLGEVLAGELEVPAALAPITLRQLATHSAGLPRNPVNRRDLPESPGVMLPYSVVELYDGLGETRLEAAPGERWSYSNLGYALLGRVLEVASARSYAELLRERITAPLGLGDTMVGVAAEAQSRLAACYWPGDYERTEREPWRIGEVAAFAGLTSSLADLARFVSRQYAGGADGLPPDVLASLHEPLVDIDASIGRRMSPGWFVDHFPGVGDVLGHGGEVDGHSACIAFLPRARAGIVVLANLGGDAAETLAIALMQGALPSLLQR